MDKPCITDRRIFLKATAAVTASAAGVVPFSVFASPARDPGVNIVGPKPGYSPQIGTMVSMLTWMQRAVVGPVQGMTQNDLDHLLDANANTIGALLLHLAATETYYQMHTFQAMKLGQLATGGKAEMGSGHGARGRGP